MSLSLGLILIDGLSCPQVAPCTNVCDMSLFFCRSHGALGEPNDWQVEEDVLNLRFANGQWNDLPRNFTVPGYIVEFDMPIREPSTFILFLAGTWVVRATDTFANTVRQRHKSFNRSHEQRSPHTAYQSIWGLLLMTCETSQLADNLPNVVSIPYFSLHLPAARVTGIDSFVDSFPLCFRIYKVFDN